MPLEHGSSKEAFSHNVAELVNSGHAQKQALAIAYKEKEGKDAADGTVKCAGVMYVNDNKVLLLKRFDGAWDLPGGHLEPGEEAINGARRESGEEIGHTPAHDQLWQIDFQNNGSIHYTTYCCHFAVEPILNTDEHTEYRWFAFGDLPEVMHPKLRATVDKYTRSYMGYGLDSARSIDGNGFIEIKSNPISKAGIFEYLGRTIDPTLDPDKRYRVLRPPEELAKKDTIDSFKLVPWIDEHVMLGSSDSGMLAPELKGIEGVIGEDVFYDDTDRKLKANIKVFSTNMDDLIKRGKRELSAGYRCKYKISAGVWEGQQYDVIQHDIRGNHLALVREGRMGPDVAVLDHMKFTFDARDIMAEPEMKKEMDELKKMVGDGLKAMDEKLTAMDKRVKDALEDEESGDPAIAADKHGKDGKGKDSKHAKDGKHAKDKEDDKDGEDESEEEEKKKGEDKKAMDAAIKSAMDSAVAPLQETIKSLLAAQNSGRDAAMKATLQNQLNTYGVAVDGADDLDLGALRAAAVKKLNIRCDAGSEAVALDGYFTDRPAPGSEIGFALDSVAHSKTGQAVEQFFNGKAA